MMNDSAASCASGELSNGSSPCANLSVSDYDAASFTHVFPAVYGLLCSVGVLANALVIYAVATCKKKLVSDVYVLNLAVADLLFLLVMPFNIHQLVWERQWVFGAFMCKAVVVVDVSNQFTTVGIVTVLCIDRYIAIVHPMSENRTIQGTIIINLAVWLGSFLLTIPVMIYAKVISKKHSSVCMINLDGPQDMYWYTLYQSTLGFLVPLIIISTFYSLTLYHVFQSMRRVKRKQSLWAKRATKMVLMVIALFLLCWTPYHVIQVINLGIQEPTSAFVYAYNISICLSYSHSCINPLMLLIFAQNYCERLCRHRKTRSNMSKTTVKTEGCSSMSPDTAHRLTII
ncbi:melanin-concentrating hormone receptor 2 [Ictalurus furcatus]|uniref:melanin-concentrating hormone receptor 2 n=1 Tax=Ictalurus furcatus TaxID=66913 RepID=UPI0023503CB8|nr:melanin-concentrating hormone receptor 2 [Ictalurus furcatus]